MLRIAIQKSLTSGKLVYCDRLRILLVWSAFLVMMLVALVNIYLSGHNVPFAEDWKLVHALTGMEPDLSAWLWSLNNEHRVPFPRLVLLGLLKITSGDFRAGMYFNVMILGILAIFMILVARHLRGGRTSLADSFFPITLLHLGNGENLLWSWPITFVIPTVLTLGVFIAILYRPYLANVAVAIFSGICVILLPLSGANGLLYTPFLALWLIYCGLINIYKFRYKGRSWISSFLIASGIVALILGFLYFIDYKPPNWWEPSPSIEATLITAAKFLAFGFGPPVQTSWNFSIIVVNLFLLITGIVSVIEVFKHKGVDKQRAFGVLLFFGNIIIFALAFGWGRASILEHWFRTRYALLAAPALITAFFIWMLVKYPYVRSLAQYGLLIGMLILLPFNTKAGLWWRNYYSKGMEKLENDISSGLPALTIAQRNRDFLIHWWDHKQLAEAMLLLKEANIGPFVNIETENQDDFGATTKD